MTGCEPVKEWEPEGHGLAQAFIPLAAGEDEMEVGGPWGSLEDFWRLL
jgi:hypothetical protein